MHCNSVKRAHILALGPHTDNFSMLEEQSADLCGTGSKMCNANRVSLGARTV